MGESILRDRETPFKGRAHFVKPTAYRKGIGLIFPNRNEGIRLSGQSAVTQTNSETSAGSGREFSFLFNRQTPWNGLVPRYGSCLVKHRASCGVRCLRMALENPRERVNFLPVVPITAAGLQGEQPLVDRTM